MPYRIDQTTAPDRTGRRRTAFALRFAGSPVAYAIFWTRAEARRFADAKIAARSLAA